MKQYLGAKIHFTLFHIEMANIKIKPIDLAASVFTNLTNERIINLARFYKNVK